MHLSNDKIPWYRSGRGTPENKCCEKVWRHCGQRGESHLRLRKLYGVTASAGLGHGGTRAVTHTGTYQVADLLAIRKTAMPATSKMKAPASHNHCRPTLRVVSAACSGAWVCDGFSARLIGWFLTQTSAFDMD